MTVNDFIKVMQKLPAHTPISEEYEDRLGQNSGHWWSSQREHMIEWYKVQKNTGTGPYTRKTPNRSARTTYQRLNCPSALIWMAEALGEDEDRVREAAEAAVQEPKKLRRSGIIRRVIPWSRIYQLASSKL